MYAAPLTNEYSTLENTPTCYLELESPRNIYMYWSTHYAKSYSTPIPG